MRRGRSCSRGRENGEGEEEPDDIGVGDIGVIVELIGKDQKSLVGLQPPLNTVYGNASFRHQVENEDKTMVWVRIEAPSLQFM